MLKYLILVFLACVSCVNKTSNITNSANPKDSLANDKSEGIRDDSNLGIIYSKYLQEHQVIPISLPFSRKVFYQDFFDNPDTYKNKYHSYKPTDEFTQYLIKIGYDAEDYACYVLPNKYKDFLILIVEIIRGDDYPYLLITGSNKKVISHKDLTRLDDMPSDDDFEINNKLEVKINVDGQLITYLIQEDGNIVDL